MRPLLLLTIVIPLLGIVNAAITATDPASELQLLNHVMLPFVGEDLRAFLNPPENFSPSDNPDDVYFFLYNNPMAINQFEKIEFYDRASIQSLHWYKDAPVKILIHGFTQSQNSSMPAMIKNAYLERMRQTDEKFNIICVDWGRLAGSLKSTILPIYTRATRNVEPAGKRVGELIARLVELGIVTPEKVHVIGFSLGAHVAGMAGSTVQSLTGQSIGRLTGLDPAGPLFYADIPNLTGRTLVKEDAHFVDIIHTSWGSYGIAKKIGDADFYPNFGVLPIQTQPYCLVAIANQRPLQVCSHNMAPVFYSMSILRDLNACQCKSFLEYKTFCRRVCYQPATFGEDWETTNTGDYYIFIPSRLFYEQEEQQQQPMLRGSYDNTKMDIINAMPEVEEEEEEHNELMRESNSKQMNVKSSGRLIGMQVTPINLDEVVILNNMRNSQDGYLFWSGLIVPNQATTILVPEILREKFMTETSKITSRIVHFDPVDMQVSEKATIIRTNRVRAVESLATNLSTPLTPTAQRRLPQIFTTASFPEKRYTFVIIYNTLGETFRLQQTTCSTGIWSRDYLPESEIKPHSTTIYRVESQGFLTGVTDCIAHYGTMDGMTSFRLSTSTPFTGTNQARGVTSDDSFQIRSSVGRLHNNMARFVIY